MSNLIRISEAASLALHTMSCLPEGGKDVVTAKHVAATLGVSEAHLSKVLQRLVKAGLVKSERGPHGGFCLARPGGDITLLDVFEAIEGTLEPVDCLLGTMSCGGKCILGDLIRSVNRQIGERLAHTKVSDVWGVFGEAASHEAQNSQN